MDDTPFSGVSTRSFTFQRSPRKPAECRSCGSSLAGRLKEKRQRSIGGGVDVAIATSAAAAAAARSAGLSTPEPPLADLRAGHGARVGPASRPARASSAHRPYGVAAGKRAAHQGRRMTRPRRGGSMTNPVACTASQTL